MADLVAICWQHLRVELLDLHELLVETLYLLLMLLSQPFLDLLVLERHLALIVSIRVALSHLSLLLVGLDGELEPLKDHDSLIVDRHAPTKVYLLLFGPFFDTFTIATANTVASDRLALLFPLLDFLWAQFLILSYQVVLNLLHAPLKSFLHRRICPVGIIEVEAILADIDVDEHIGDVLIEEVVTESCK